MPTLFEAGIKTLLFLLLLSGLQALRRGFGMVGVGVSIHDTYVVNTFLPLRPEVYDEDIPLHLSFVL